MIRDDRPEDQSGADPPCTEGAKGAEEDLDRAEILARRRHFVVIALSGLAAGAGCSPCLKVGSSTSSATTTTTTGTTDSSTDPSTTSPTTSPTTGTTTGTTGQMTDASTTSATTGTTDGSTTGTTTGMAATETSSTSGTGSPCLQVHLKATLPRAGE